MADNEVYPDLKESALFMTDNDVNGRRDYVYFTGIRYKDHEWSVNGSPSRTFCEAQNVAASNRGGLAYLMWRVCNRRVVSHHFTTTNRPDDIMPKLKLRSLKEDEDGCYYDTFEGWTFFIEKRYCSKASPLIKAARA